MRRLAYLLLAACATEPAPPAIEELPACASPYVAEIVRRTRDYVDRGSVTEARYLTTRNVADPDLLLDGPEIFPAFRRLIGRARHEVALQTYVWEPETDPTDEILAGLIDLDRRRALEPADQPPVVVRLLFDVSALGFGSTYTALPRTHAAIASLALDPRHVQVELAGFYHETFGNLHVKTLVVDGREAIITGANPQAHHDYATPWRDAGFKLSGEVAGALQDDFDDAWTRSQQWTCGADEARGAEACSAPTHPITHAFDLERMSQPDTCVAMLVLTRDADPTIGANQLDNTQDTGFLAAFGAATEVIRMQTPNLNDDAAKGALIAAVTRGVRVDLVLSKGFNEATESLPGQGGSNAETVEALYDTLAGAGIAEACDRLRIRWHARDGVAIEGNGDYASHAKYTSIDGAIAIVGTANMDTQAWNNSRETNVVVDDPAITRAWDAQMFQRDFDGGVIVDRCR